MVVSQKNDAGLKSINANILDLQSTIQSLAVQMNDILTRIKTLEVQVQSQEEEINSIINN